MTSDEARDAAIRHWLKLAHEALEAASSELNARRFTFAVNRSYYACFYCVSALLLADRRRFVKHAGVRGAFHQHLVKTGRVDPKWGAIYDHLFEIRQEGDYQEQVTFEPEAVETAVRHAENFVREMEALI